jgi:hypothetical protein
VASQVLDITHALGSYVIVQQLLDLARLLEPHRAADDVGVFLEQLNAGLRERLALFRWLGKDGRTEHGIPGAVA